MSDARSRQIRALVSRIRDLESALLKFGDCRSDCMSRNDPREIECDCGAVAAIEALLPETAE